MRWNYCVEDGGGKNDSRRRESGRDQALVGSSD